MHEADEACSAIAASYRIFVLYANAVSELPCTAAGGVAGVLCGSN